MAENKSEIAASAAAGTSVEREVYRRLPPDSPIHKLIGQIADDWSQVERLLDLIIWRLAGLSDPTGACLTSQITGSQARLNVIDALCRMRPLGGGVLNEIEETKKCLRGIQTKRNRVLHDAWYVDEDDKIHQFRASAVGEWATGFFEVDAAYLKKAILQIGRRIERVNQLRNAITASL